MNWEEMTPSERLNQIRRVVDSFRKAIERFWLALSLAFARLSDEDQNTVIRLLAIMDRTPKERIRKKLRRRVIRIIASGVVA